MFELRITQQLSGGQTLDIIETKIKVAKIKKVVHSLYDRLVISEPVIDTVVPTIYVPNIWAIQSQNFNRPEKISKKKRRKHEEKEFEKRAKADSIQSERD